MNSNFFDDEKFKGINKEVLNELNSFMKKIEGKQMNDILFYIIDFYNNVLSKNFISDKDREMIIHTMFLSLSSEDREKLSNILNFVDDLVK